MYNLAAHRAHLAIAEEEPETLIGTLRDLLDRDDEKADRTARAEHLREAERSATDLLKQTAATLEIDRALRRKADVPGEIHPTEEGPIQPLSDKLHEFLRKTVEPSAAVLLAGLTRRLIGKGSDRRIAKREDLLAALDGTPDPDALVDYARRAETLNYRVHYNLACYFSESPDDQSRRSWEHLERALTSAPRLEAAALADWAGRDPTLKKLRAAKGREFNRLTAAYRLPTITEQRDDEQPAD